MDFIYLDDLKSIPVIYKVTNIKTGKCYIGQAINFKKRFKSHHRTECFNPHNVCYNTKFYKALRKYGLNNFTVQILEVCEPSKLDEREIFYIEQYDSFKTGYNSSKGGQFVSPNANSEESKRKARQTLEKNKKLKSENHPRAKLTNDEVFSIRQRYIDGESVNDIYQDFKDIYSVVDTFKDIVFGRHYKEAGNIPSKEQIRYTNKGKNCGSLSPEIVNEIRKLHNSGILARDIAKKFNVTRPQIYSIWSGTSYVNC